MWCKIKLNKTFILSKNPLDPGECEQGSIRVVDGIIEQEGRVEVCIDSVWGSVCDERWDKTDAHVVCRQMGHPELGITYHIYYYCLRTVLFSEPIVFTGSYFGDGKYPIVYSNLKCGGWENDITDCGKDNYLDFSCSRNNVAGLLCGYGKSKSMRSPVQNMYI